MSSLIKYFKSTISGLTVFGAYCHTNLKTLLGQLCLAKICVTSGDR